jgi:gliding motility-associated-like protein
MRNKLWVVCFIFLLCLKAFVLQAQTITAAKATGVIIACAGTASVSPQIQQFAISGSNLTGDITATAPTGFELSLSAASGYGAGITLTQTNGTVSNTVLYVRSAASAAAGNISENVTLSSSGAQSQTVGVTGVVNPLPTVNAVTNQTAINGVATPAINFTGTGNDFNWVNNTPGIGLSASGSGNIGSFIPVNTGSSSVVATITATPASVGFAYITNSGDGTISVINVATNTVVATLNPPHDPFCVCISPDGSKVYVGCSDGSSTVTVINAITNAIIATITANTSGESTGIAVSPDGTMLYVADFVTGTVSVINTATSAVVAIITVGSQPYGIAVSPDGSKVYVSISGSNNVAVINTATNTVAASIIVGLAPQDVALSPDGSRLYVATLGLNGLSVINTANNSTIAVIPTANDPSAIALSPDGATVYVATDSNIVTVVDAATNAVVSTIAVGTDSNGLCVSADGHFLYVTNEGSKNVSIINTSTNTVAATVNVGIGPSSLGNFVTPGTGCTGTPVKFTITVIPNGAAILPSGAPGAVSTSYGAPSVPTNFTINYANLTTPITVTPPPGFEVSSDNINFSPTVTVGGPNASGPITIYVRLAATTNAGTYNGNIVLSSPGVTSVDVYMPNSVVSPAIINVTGSYGKQYGETATNFTLYYNTPGFASNLAGLQNGNTFYSINFAFGDGAAPTDPVGIYPDAVTLSDFEGANGFLPSNYAIHYFPFDMDVVPAPLTITANNVSKPYGTTLANESSSTSFTVTGLQNNETVGTVAITYGAGAPASSAPGVYTGSVVATNASGGTFSPSNYTITYQAGNITIAVPPPPVIAYTGQPAALQTIYGTPSFATNIQVSGANLTSGITVTPPLGFEISIDNTTFAGTIALTPNTAGAIAATIYIRLAATTPVGSYNNSLVLNSTGADNITVPLNGTVIPAPLTIAATPVTKTYGSVLESGAGSMAFTAIGLQNDETVGSVTLTCGAGSAAGDAVGVYNNSLVPSAATGGTFNPANYTINYPYASITVVPAALTITADNASRLFATPNPTLTVTYTGFVNNDGPAQLTALPVVSTTAVPDSPIGQYPITANDASSPDYTITYVAGTLTIYPSPQNIKIPNTFTPNGDGVNDVWNIGDLQFYPNCTVDIYTRWGRQLFQSRGYGQAWDGTYNGQPLPVGTYYYVIGLNDGTATRLSGYVVIIR